jgi:hypothetical protein
MDHLDQAPSAFLARPERRARIITALSMLRDAWDAARDVRRSAWDFAVKREELRAAGIADAYLLWLMTQGYMRHARGKLRASGPTVPSSGWGSLDLGSGSCFVLTKEGALIARGLDTIRVTPLPGESAQGVEAVSAIRPHWDGELRRLSLDGVLVKHFRVPAWSQELILESFEEESWPRHIDDPLPQRDELDPKVRLRYAIKGLNRSQTNKLLNFEGDGHARGIVWRLLKRTPQSYPNRTRTAP